MAKDKKTKEMIWLERSIKKTEKFREMMMNKGFGSLEEELELKSKIETLKGLLTSILDRRDPLIKVALMEKERGEEGFIF